ncbi:MAG: hypothetical protein ACTSPV_03950 [Candidatus Hodarchaeales archaeon]
MKNKIIALILMVSILISSMNMTNIIAATNDAESISFSLIPGKTKQAVALVPDRDFPSITINSDNPVNISHRSLSNTNLDEFNFMDTEEATLNFPINMPVTESPLLYNGNIDYQETSYLLFEKNSDDSYGEFTVGTNHTAFAITSDDEQTFRVEPDYNFHLRIVAKNTGPIQLRINFFPDPGFGNRYKSVNLFDPNGVAVSYYNYFYVNDEYFIFIAEEKGNYALQFEPVDTPIFFNVVSKTYKAEELKVEEEFKPIIKGLSDSELTDAIKDQNLLTFDWFKFSPDEGDVCIKEIQTMRGTPVTVYFAPGRNNTQYRGLPATSIGKDNRPEYVLVIHDSLARYLIGAYKVPINELEVENPLNRRFKAEEIQAYSVSVSSPSALRFFIKSDLKKVSIEKVLSNSVNIPQLTQGSITELENLYTASYFAVEGQYIFLLKNSDNSEKWAEISLAVRTVSENREFDSAESFENIIAPNVSTELNPIVLDHIESGITETEIMHFRSTYSDEMFYSMVMLGADYFDSNDLIARYGGQNIEFAVRFAIFSEFNGELLKTYNTFSTLTVSNSSGTDVFYFFTDFITMSTSDKGDYWVTLDTYALNGTELIPYPAHLRFAFVDITSLLTSTTMDIEFDSSNRSTILNYEFNASRHFDFYLKVPLSGFNWTEVEIHTINGTVNQIDMLMDIPLTFAIGNERVHLKYDIEENPISVNQVGNLTTAFGIMTEREYIYLCIMPTALGPDPVVLNITLQRIPTQVLHLKKATNIKPVGTGAPGFEWFITLFALVLVISHKSKRKK